MPKMKTRVKDSYDGIHFNPDDNTYSANGCDKRFGGKQGKMMAQMQAHQRKERGIK